MARKMKTMDGNHAAAHASYAYSDVAVKSDIGKKCLTLPEILWWKKENMCSNM